MDELDLFRNCNISIQQKQEFLKLYEDDINKIEEVVLKKQMIIKKQVILDLEVFMCNGITYNVEFVPSFA